MVFGTSGRSGARWPQVAVANTDGKLALNAVKDAFQLEIARQGQSAGGMAFSILPKSDSLTAAWTNCLILSSWPGQYVVCLSLFYYLDLQGVSRVQWRSPSSVGASIRLCTSFSSVFVSFPSWDPVEKLHFWDPVDGERFKGSASFRKNSCGSPDLPNLFRIGIP